MGKGIPALVMIACLSGGVAPAAAQDPESGDVKLTAQTRIGSSAAESKGAPANRARSKATGSDIRLGLQTRIDAFSLVGVQTSLGSGAAGLSSAFTPIVTPGVRLLEERLYLGLGLGFSGYNVDVGADAEQTRSAFSLAPMAMFDVLADDWGALSLGGWLSLSSLGDTETCDADSCVTDNDGAFGWGLNLMAGLRGQLTPAIAVGGEFGWGFISVSGDGDNDDDFVHGLLGLLLIEATLGL